MLKIPETRYIVLARKYRPQTFGQVVGQDHITKAMSNAIKNERVAHSILLSGPRGTGKTTIARIFAKTVNCKYKLKDNPCNKCKSCNDIATSNGIDVFEIDGASNNSVEQIRSLRENVRYLPINSKSKIYIIDEVHMLSTSAFNALLKTLEEPPEHVLFVLATTEYHKIPATITSRCQHYSFRRIKTNIIQDVLKQICGVESFILASESLHVISNKSQGSLRDALSLLDQVMSCYDKTATHQQVAEIIGSVDRSFIHKIAEAIFSDQIILALKQIDLIYQYGYDLKVLYGDVLEYFRHLLLLKAGNDAAEFINLLPNEIEIMKTQVKFVSTSYIDQILFMLAKEEAYIMDTKYVKLAFEILLLKLKNIQSVLSIDTIIKHLDKLKKTGDSNRGTHFLPPARDNNHTVEGCSNLKEIDDTGKDVKRSDLSTIWQQVNEKLYESRPALATRLSRCCIREVCKDSFEVIAINNKNALSEIRENFDFIKKKLEQALKQYTRNEVVISLGENIKKDKDLLTGSQHEPSKNYSHKHAANHPLVAYAKEIFEGKVEYIDLSNKSE